MRLLTLFLLFSSMLPAQRSLQGMLTDAATGTPLAYTYVFLEHDQQYGVISNERGEYRILLDSTQMQDRLVFSLISYQAHYLRLADLKPEQTHYNQQLNTSFLELHPGRGVSLRLATAVPFLPKRLLRHRCYYRH